MLEGVGYKDRQRRSELWWPMMIVTAELLKMVVGAMNQAQKLKIIINTNHSQAEKTKYNSFPAT